MIVCSETCLSHVSLSDCLAPVSLSCNTHHRFLCHTIIQTSLNSPHSPPLTIIITFTIYTTLVFSTKNLVFLPYLCHCLEHCPPPPQPLSPSIPKPFPPRTRQLCSFPSVLQPQTQTQRLLNLAIIQQSLYLLPPLDITPVILPLLHRIQPYILP